MQKHWKQLITSAFFAPVKYSNAHIVFYTHGGEAMQGNFIAYYRVSTDKQDLGIDAQRKAVSDYLNGSGAQLIGEYQERESGKNNQRPELQKALELCRKCKATLVIAKLDRLARNVHFISGLMESRVKFVACDMPHAGDFELHIRASLAQEERRMISARTKAALRVLKNRTEPWISKRGRLVHKLGNPNAGTAAFTGYQVIKDRADGYAAKTLPVVAAIQARGIKSFRAIAAELERMKMLTPRGGSQWAPAQVRNLMLRQAH